MLWFTVLLIVTVGVRGQEKYGSRCEKHGGQVSGICVPWSSCTPVYSHIVNIQRIGQPINAGVNEFINGLYCDVSNKMIHVCCPESDIQFNPDGLSILKRDDCGYHLIRKLSYAYDTGLFEYRWMALLIYEDRRDPYKCGGSLISKQYVLTAAHCIKPTLLRVRLGEHDTTTNPDCIVRNGIEECAPLSVDVEIKDTIIHPKYRPEHNDIALIRLEREVELQRHIKTICLPIYDHLRNTIHEQYDVTGWGRTETGKISDVLKVSTMRRVNNRRCEDQLGLKTQTLNEGHICIGGQNWADACKGDSGGPMGYSDIYGGRPRFVQYGVVSFGQDNCGTGSAPSVYMNVSHYMQWITDHII